MCASSSYNCGSEMPAAARMLMRHSRRLIGAREKSSGADLFTHHQLAEQIHERGEILLQPPPTLEPLLNFGEPQRTSKQFGCEIRSEQILVEPFYRQPRRVGNAVTKPIPECLAGTTQPAQKHVGVRYEPEVPGTQAGGSI